MPNPISKPAELDGVASISQHQGDSARLLIEYTDGKLAVLEHGRVIEAPEFEHPRVWTQIYPAPQRYMSPAEEAELSLPSGIS